MWAANADAAARRSCLKATVARMPLRALVALKRNLWRSDAKCRRRCVHGDTDSPELDDSGSAVEGAVLSLGPIDRLGVGDRSEGHHLVERDPPRRKCPVQNSFKLQVQREWIACALSEYVRVAHT
jgi:hypothetical protein